jgi:hypothetical protein
LGKRRRKALEGGEGMRFTAIYKPKGRPVFHETFSCSSINWAMWYAKGRAERFGVELVAVVEA